MNDMPTRYAASIAFPPYTYLSGRAPHPIRDPLGHMHVHHFEAHEPLNALRWRDAMMYCYAIDLFNFGYYWESHEAGESLWKLAPHETPERTLLQLLIKLAAAGVKAREGRAVGVQRHALRAIELTKLLAQSLGVSGNFENGIPNRLFAGISLANLITIADEFLELAVSLPDFPIDAAPVCVVATKLVLVESFSSE